MSKYTLPDFLSAALITIDMQQDTLDGQPCEIPGTSAILPTLKNLLQSFRETEKPIIHIMRIYQPDGSNVDLCRRELVEQGAQIFLAGSSGCVLAPDLLPDQACHLNMQFLLRGQIQQVGPHEVVIYKPRWGAFYQTPLETYLRQHEVSTLIFTGCNFANCPRASIYEASERDFRVVVVEDAISGIYERRKAVPEALKDARSDLVGHYYCSENIDYLCEYHMDWLLTIYARQFTLRPIRLN
jgi:nicotinamidase-related amidase